MVGCLGVLSPKLKGLNEVWKLRGSGLKAETGGWFQGVGWTVIIAGGEDGEEAAIVGRGEGKVGVIVAGGAVSGEAMGLGQGAG